MSAAGGATFFLPTLFHVIRVVTKGDRPHAQPPGFLSIPHDRSAINAKTKPKKVVINGGLRFVLVALQGEGFQLSAGPLWVQTRSRPGLAAHKPANAR